MDTTTDGPSILGTARVRRVFTQTSLTLQTVSEPFRTPRTWRPQIAHVAVSESPDTRSKSEEQA
jgi:hypothetical protein